MITNGFYDVNKLSIKLKYKFLQEAIYRAYRIECQSKYKNGNSYRFVDTELSIRDVISKSLINPNHRLNCIDRFIYNQGKISKDLCEYEITLSFDWTFLYIFVNEENFFKLIDDFKLKLINYEDLEINN
jgi:hypothetical protein